MLCVTDNRREIEKDWAVVLLLALNALNRQAWLFSLDYLTVKEGEINTLLQQLGELFKEEKDTFHHKLSTTEESFALDLCGVKISPWGFIVSKCDQRRRKKCYTALHSYKWHTSKSELALGKGLQPFLACRQQHWSVNMLRQQHTLLPKSNKFPAVMVINIRESCRQLVTMCKHSYHAKH